MTPSLEIGNGNWAVKSDSLLGYKTIDGKYYPREIGVTRATTATRINADGLVELTPYNLLTWSEEFDNAAWTKNNSTITANSTTAPNGTLTADTMTVSNFLSRVDQTPTLPVGTYTISVWMKTTSVTTAGDMRFYLTIDGVNTTISFTPTTEWQRFTHTFTANTSITAVQIRGNGYIGSVSIWGAQLVEGSTAKDYLPTTDRLDIARIDYSSGEAALLVEPQRTNLLLQSSSFDNVYWTKTNGVLTANNTTSPEGTLTADLFTETTFTNSSASVSNSSLISVTSGVAYTTTIYAKKGNDKYLYLSNYYNSANRYYTLIVDLESGTITKEQAGSLITSFSSSITSVGDGWYRISLTQTTASTQLYFILRISNSATPTIDTSYGFITIPSNNNRSLYIWGAQLEAGAYPTSYIPTTSAAVTRNVDLIEKSGISSLINSEEGVLFWEALVFSESGNNMIQISDNSDNNLISLYYNNGFISSQGKSNGTTSFSFSYDVDVTSYHKVAVKWKQNDFSLWVDGFKVATDVSGNPPIINSLNRLDFKYYWGGNPFYGKIKQLQIHKTALTDEQLEALTTI